jgi:hypothetical protein
MGITSSRNLMPGGYYVEFIKPAGYVSAPQDQGVNDTLLSWPCWRRGPADRKTICTLTLSGNDRP